MFCCYITKFGISTSKFFEFLESTSREFPISIIFTLVLHRRDWFRMSHKGYRNFTKMSAKRQQNRSTPGIQAAFSSNNSLFLAVRSTYFLILFPNVKLDWNNRCYIIFDICHPR